MSHVIAADWTRVRRLPRQHESNGTAELQRQLAKLLGRLRIAIIFGGDKNADRAVIYPTANPRSWKSYEHVASDIAQALRRLGCEHVMLLPDDMRLGKRLKQERIDFAWLNTGGVQGYCSVSHAPAMLEMFGVPYLGHDPLIAATLDSKHFLKRQLIAFGIPTAPFSVWHPKHGMPDPAADSRFKAAFADWDGNFIVKPVSGRASLHVHYVEDASGLAHAATKVYASTRNHVLIEGYLPGREYCIAVCGPMVARAGALERLDRPFAFAGVERVLEENERIFTSMDVKAISAERVRPLDPGADAFVLDSLEELACALYTELSLETLVRLDVRADARGNLFVLEANPKPDLKAPTAAETSLICAGLDRYGMSYDDLILSLFAGRVEVLLSERRASADHLLRLMLG